MKGRVACKPIGLRSTKLRVKQTQPKLGRPTLQPVLRYCLALLAAMTLALPAASQVTAPDSGTILQTLPKAPPTSESGLDLENILQKRRVVSDVEDFQLSIRSFVVKGSTALTDEEARVILEPFKGEGKTFQDVLDAAAALRRRLGELGYFIADVVVPEQDVTNGMIELIVLEGRIGQVSVEYAPDVLIDRKIIEGYLSTLREGDLVRTRTVERALFLVNDLRGVSATSTFKPGAKPGTADLVVTVEKTPLISGYFDADINGASASGKQRIGVNLDLNNFNNMGGLLNIRAIRGMAQKTNLNEPQQTIYGRASILMPVSRFGFKVGASISRVEYELGDDPALLALGASGTSRIGSVFGSYPFIRSRNLNLIANLQFDNRSFEDIVALNSSIGHKGSNLMIAGLNADFRDTFLGGGINLVGVNYTRGRLDLRTPELINRDAGGSGSPGLRTEGEYEKYQVNLGRLQQVTRDWLFYANIQWQGASKNLDSSEKMVLGGAYGIRALSPIEGVGDEGYLGTFELRRAIAGKYVLGNLVGTIFYDYGEIRRNHAPLLASTPNADHRDGAGFGVYWEPRGWYVRASVAGRLPRLYLQAIKYF